MPIFGSPQPLWMRATKPSEETYIYVPQGDGTFLFKERTEYPTSL